jgi:TP901 family phage tail tape measure protein
VALRTVGVRLTAEIGDYQAKLKAASQSTRDFQGELSKASKKGNLDKVTERAAIMGAGLLAAAGAAVKMSADFDKAMSAVSAATHAPAAQIALLRAAAIQAGKDTQYSATEAAQGITELSKAGVQTADVLGGGLKGALALAAAGQISVGEAAETAASAMTQFRLAGNQVPHVADLLAAAAGKAQGSVHDMGYALSQSGLVASQFGLSIEDTTGVLAEFANAGLIGSDAGTSFKTMLLAMANPSDVTSKKMASLGLTFYDAQGKFIGLSGVAEMLRKQLSGLTDEQRQGTLAQIFGNDAVRAASILYADGASGVAKWKNAVNDSGYATETAAKLTDNLAGDVERLKGSFETMAIQAGSGANGGLRVLTKALDAMVSEFGKLPPAVGSTVTVLVGAVGAALLLGAGWLKARKSSAAFRAELELMGPTGARTASALSKVSSVAGKLGLAFIAIEAAGAVISHFQKDLNPQLDAMAVGLQRFATDGQTAGESARVLGSHLDDLKVGFKFLADDSARSKTVKNLQQGLESIVPGLSGTNTSLAKTQERISAVDSTLAQLVSAGNVGQAKSDFDALAKQLAVGGVSMDEFRRQFPQYAASLETAGGATKGAASKIGDLSSALKQGAEDQKPFRTQAQLTAAAAKGERDAIADLAKSLKAETDPVFGMLNAQQGLTQAQKEAAKAVKEHGRNSAEAKDATRKLAEAAIELQASAGKLGGEFNGKLTPAMRDTLKAAGLTQGQIKAVGKQFGEAKKDADKFAGKYEAQASAPGAKQAKKDLDLAYTSANGFAGPYAAQVSAPGAKQAKKDIDLAYTSANGFAGPYIAKVSVTGDKAVKSKLDDLRNEQFALAAGPTAAAAQAATSKYYTRKATGGPINGPGTSTSDSIPALLSDGEYVIKASSVKRVGLSNLDVINNEGRLPQAFASGGMVWPYRVDASKTKVPSLPPAGGAGPGGGQTYHWILDVVRRAFPGLHATSTFRAGAVTLSGNRSYHAVGRAVDFPPSKALAQWVNANYFRATRELITPWNSLNIKNGSRHTYTGDIFAQHAGTGRFKGNAHDHWAMAHGGIIPEHVVGVGRSGRTYEFGELGPERVTPLRGYARGGLVNVARTTSTSGSRLDTADAMLSAASAVAALTAALKENGRTWSTATQKGRDNRSALIAGVKAAQDAAKAKYDETGSLKAANKVYDEYVHKLDESMKKMHVNAATRRELIKAYSERPKYDTSTAAPSNSGDLIKATTDHIGIEDSLQSFRGAVAWKKPTFDLHTEAGRSELGSLFGFLNAASSGAQSMYEYTGNAKQATAYYQGYISQLRSILIKSGMSAKDADALIKRYGRITLTPKSNRWGGLYEHAATGSLRDAQIAAGGPTQYAWAESSTGGELFAPKNGNLQKTRQEVGWAVANWWGGNVNWGGQSAGKNVTVQATIPITLGAETITQQVEMVVDTALGKVVDAIVYQTA